MDALRRALEEYAASRQEWTLGKDDALANVKKYLHTIKYLLETAIPEVLSRINHAASALFVEVARGFFLPLCTVALGCLGRIRLVMIRQARQYVIELKTMLAEYKEMEEIHTLLDPTFYETTLHLYNTEDKPAGNEGTAKFDAERTLQTLGLTKGRKQTKTMNEDAIMGKEKGEAEDVGDETSAQAAASSNTADSFHADDIGETFVAPLVNDAIQHEAPLSTLNQQEDSDKNLDLLQQIKKATDRKRKNGDRQPTCPESKRKEKKRKKESKKKKKDVFDEIFGDA